MIQILTFLLRRMVFAADEKRICADESILMDENVRRILNFEKTFSDFCRMSNDDALILQTRVQRLHSLVRHGPEVRMEKIDYLFV